MRLKLKPIGSNVMHKESAKRHRSCVNDVLERLPVKLQPSVMHQTLAVRYSRLKTPDPFPSAWKILRALAICQRLQAGLCEITQADDMTKPLIIFVSTPEHLYNHWNAVVCRHISHKPKPMPEQHPPVTPK